MNRCYVCGNDLFQDPEKVFRISRKQHLGITPEAIRFDYKANDLGNICEKCAGQAKRIGFRVISIARFCVLISHSAEWYRFQANEGIAQLAAVAKAERGRENQKRKAEVVVHNQQLIREA